jgi:hypothetical protein
MRKSSLIIIIAAALCAGAYADPDNMINLKPPSGLDDNQAELTFLHRFIGSVSDRPLETVFGTFTGANVDVGFRYMVKYGIEPNLSFYWLNEEIVVGASYVYRIPAAMLNLQADLQYFNFTAPTSARVGGLWAAVSMQTDPLFGYVSPMLVTGYDSYYNRLGFAAGALVKIVENLSFMAEVYPPFGIGGTQHTNELGPYTGVALALRLDTFGHNFVLQAGNNYQMGERRLMAGAPGGANGFLSSVYLGFNIHRRFDF